MPKSIQSFSQPVVLLPKTWQSPDMITNQFEHEGHKKYFVRTIVAYVSSLHDVFYLWRIRVVTGDVSDLSTFSIDRLYPLSSHQRAILVDITEALTSRRHVQDNRTPHNDEQSSSWHMYRVLLGKPGTGKSQVLIRAIHHAIENEMSVLVAAQVALLAQGYHKIFLCDIETDTSHGTFNIPVEALFADDMNYGLNKFDLVVVDEASMILAPTFHAMATTFNRLNLRPVVVFAGDKHQQQPLQTVAGRVTATTSIINDSYTFHAGNAIKHFLYQQFWIVDEEYGKFLDLIPYTQPTQQQLDSVQHNMILCPEGDLSDNDIWQAFMSKDASTVMTVSRRGAQCINNIVVAHLFQDQHPLARIPCPSMAESTPIYPLKDKKVLFTENRNKATRIINGQEATIISAQNNSIVLHLPEGQRVFVYPVTHTVDDRPVTYYPFTPPYAQTITKSQGQNITHLIVWLDSDLVPAGTAYVGLSRVRKRDNISFQVTPVRV